MVVRHRWLNETQMVGKSYVELTFIGQIEANSSENDRLKIHKIRLKMYKVCNCKMNQLDERSESWSS